MKTLAPFQTARGAFTPDHIVYAKSYSLISDDPTRRKSSHLNRNTVITVVVEVPGKAVFCAGATGKGAETVALLARDGALVQQLTAAFGGPRTLSDAGRGFIENWEAESYRKKVAGGASVRLSGKVAVVTGGLRDSVTESRKSSPPRARRSSCGFERGRRRGRSRKTQSSGRRGCGRSQHCGRSSVESMVRAVVLACGGIDLFVANAGVLKAGSVKSFEKRDWEFVTSVNYTGYFLCVKHVSAVMARQNACCAWTDIVQVNSKSGLVGSTGTAPMRGANSNGGAHAELCARTVADRIKVNSVCPGTSSTAALVGSGKGAFVQYLNSGKVPGAKTVADVKLHYEKRSRAPRLLPVGRGKSDCLRGLSILRTARRSRSRAARSC